MSDDSSIKYAGRGGMMPNLSAGIRPDFKWKGDGRGYRDVLGLTVIFRTSPGLVQRFLPDGFAPASGDEEGMVTAYYARNRDLDWLAGGGYNMLGIDVRATFNGNADHITGDYCLVLWENRTEPILTGREFQGMPKVHADISDVLTDGEAVWIRASKEGHPIVDMRIDGLAAMTEEQQRSAEDAARHRNWMGWRYIPKIGAPGAEISQPTLYPNWPTFETASAGRGQIRIHESSFAENPTQWQFVNLIRELEPIEYLTAYQWQGYYGADTRRVRVME